MVRNTSGKVRTADIDLLAFAAVFGTLEGTFAIRKFGENLSIGTSEEDIWNGPTAQETLLTSGQTMYASCTDNTNGVGQIITVQGLDENWEVQTGRVTLTGQTQAAVTKDDGSAAQWTRVHRCYQISASPDPVGDVYIAESDTLTGGVPDTNTGVHAFIDYSDAAQQSEKAMYTVPADHHALILNITGGMEQSSGNARSADIFLEISELAEGATVSSPSWAPFRRIQELDVTNGGSVWAQENFRVPFLVGPLTNIHLRAKASAASAIIGSFELLVFLDDFLPGT